MLQTVKKNGKEKGNKPSKAREIMNNFVPLILKFYPKIYRSIEFQSRA